jgi:O-antigen ligase
LGNLVMVLVVLTDRDPPAAVRQLLTRTGFVLIPLSVLLIKYYPHLGRAFSPWTGAGYNSGAAIGKNGLGVICLVFGVAAVCRGLAALQEPERRAMVRGLLAHGAVLAMALWLFWKADSATSLGCFAVGAALLGLSRSRTFASSTLLVHLTVAGIVSLCVLGLFITTDVGLLQAMGRDPTLTTRTALWRDLLRITVDPWFGTGFESFWLGERARMLWRTHWWHPNQAHNGYLEVFLNLGWFGVMLLGVTIAAGYRNVVTALRANPALGGLRLALFVAAVLYNLTEAAFKVLHPVWIVFLLAVSTMPSTVTTAVAGVGVRDQARPSPLRPVGRTLTTPRPRRAWAPRP